MFLLIGAPVYRREWILPHWFSAIEKQNISLTDIGFIFATSKEDEETKRVLREWQSDHPQVRFFDFVDVSIKHTEHSSTGRRMWNFERYQVMTKLRNTLLEYARSLQPTYYFSLDTDIILEDTETLSTLISELESYNADAISPLAQMSKKGVHPSVMTWVDESNYRAKRLSYPIGETFQSDVIMAAKLMTPKVYNSINYEPHRQGEDLGWSKNCHKLNYKLYCASSVYVPHIMSPQMLEEYLVTGDKRAPKFQKAP